MGKHYIFYVLKVLELCRCAFLKTEDLEDISEFRVVVWALSIKKVRRHRPRSSHQLNSALTITTKQYWT